MDSQFGVTMRGLSVVLVAMIAATVAEDRHKKELRDHYEHLSYIAEFNCHQPQPRVIPVQDLFPEEEMVHRAFFPDVTVLHRCDNHVGCCPSEHLCRPKEKHSLHLPFKVTFLEDIGKHKKGSWVIEYNDFDNHTECACEEPTPVQEPMECVQLRESCDALAHSCSKLQKSCTRLSWTPDHHTTTNHPTPVEETTQYSEEV